MSINPNAVQPFNLPSKWAGASSDVVKAIRQASASTGVSFDYLMDKAKTESAFKSDIKAKTSSATGLFQFIDSTWLQTLKDHGAKHGLEDLVSKIDSDPAAKKQALELRKDPEIAAVMTAEATKQNQYYLETSVGGTIGQNELYLAHFLGLGGATKFLQAKNQNPDAPAADLFPAAAGANKNVFYESSGKKRSLNDVYAFFAKKMDGEGANNISVATAQSTPSAGRLNFVQNTSANLFQTQRISPISSPLNPALMARLSGVEQQAASLNSLMTPTAIERNFMDVALGTSGSQDKSTVSEGNLLAPFTAMILAKLATVRDTVQGKDQTT